MEFTHELRNEFQHRKDESKVESLSQEQKSETLAAVPRTHSPPFGCAHHCLRLCATLYIYTRQFASCLQFLLENMQKMVKNVFAPYRPFKNSKCKKKRKLLLTASMLSLFIIFHYSRRCIQLAQER